MPISVTIPDGLELQISIPKLVRRVGHKAAGLVRQRLRAGMGAAGPLPTGDGTPLRDTGKLINSIKFPPRGKTGGVIFATGTRENGQSNAKILGINLAKGKSPHAKKNVGRTQANRRADPMGVNAALQEAVLIEAKAEVRKQVTTKETKLVAKRKKKK